MQSLKPYNLKDDEKVKDNDDFFIEGVWIDSTGQMCFGNKTKINTNNNVTTNKENFNLFNLLLSIFQI